MSLVRKHMIGFLQENHTKTLSCMAVTATRATATTITTTEPSADMGS